MLSVVKSRFYEALFFAENPEAPEYLFHLLCQHTWHDQKFRSGYHFSIL